MTPRMRATRFDPSVFPVSLASCDRDAGKTRGPRSARIDQAAAERLRDADQKPKVLRVGCVRKRATLLNAMLRDRLTGDQMKAGQIE